MSVRADGTPGHVESNRLQLKAARIVLLGLVLAAAVQLQPSAAYADHDTCSDNWVDYPHYSDGAGGIITKGRVNCSGYPDGFHYNLILFFCGDTQPQADEQYLMNNCSYAGQDYADVIPVSPDYYTFYAPPLGQPGATGTGWWVSCFQVWVWQDHDGTYMENYYISISDPQYLSA